MRESKVNTITVPVLGADPATLYYADVRPMRIVVRNLGGGMVFVAHDSTTLKANAVTANAFRLPPGEEDVFVLAPRQGLFVIASGPGVLVSIAISEAIPTTSMES